MPIRYRIRRASTTRFTVTPIDELPSWEFTLPEWSAQDALEILAEADITRPCGLGNTLGLTDMTDVGVSYILNDSNQGTGSVRS